jgi:hypothetical protein
MNLGIIIGVSEYVDSSNNLPGCKMDANAIQNILSKTDKYDDLLFLNSNQNSAEIKERFTDFISNHKTNKVEELFFYYTGHGDFNNNEYYFLLSDYEDSKRKQTSLQNEEVDNLIKTLKPDLVVKVIDACQSGKSYIKEANGISKYFEKTQDRFNRCYFLNSSLNDQSSYQSDIISDFTKSFISSVRLHNSAEIRYKDIIDYISDDFANNPSQTPYFVIQADYTEKFCSINKNLKDYLASLSFSKATSTKNTGDKSSLLDKIAKQAEDYCEKTEALQLIGNIKDEVEKFECSTELKDVFDLKVSTHEDYEEIVKENTIGKWLDDNDHDFFARSKQIKVRKDRHSNPFGALRTSFVLGGTEEDYEWIKDGFDLDIEVPYKTIVLNMDSKYPNIESYTCRIIYLISKRQIAFFYFTTNIEEKNWDDRWLNTDIEWFHTEYPITKNDIVIEGLKKIFNDFQSKISKYLHEKFDDKKIEGK